jgi:hypothetical protein
MQMEAAEISFRNGRIYEDHNPFSIHTIWQPLVPTLFYAHQILQL